MPLNWRIFLKIVVAILRILQGLPAAVDHTKVAGLLADAIDANGIEDQGGTT